MILTKLVSRTLKLTRDVELMSSYRVRDAPGCEHFERGGEGEGGEWLGNGYWNRSRVTSEEKIESRCG